MEVVDNPEKSRFEAFLDDELVGFLDYRRLGQVIALVHTEALREGAGVGSALARFALEAARDQGLRVEPSCPFVRNYLERHPR